MKCKVFILIAFFIFIISFAVMVDAQEKAESDTIKADKSVPVTDSAAIGEPADTSDIFIAYYFHGTRRCATCKKLEAYTAEAVQDGFPELLKSGNLEWRAVNIDEDEFKHYIDDYKLYTKTVILSHIVDGKETEWKNLEKIWNLVGNKDKYIKYVQTEIETFMEKD